jgi:hypothetical protein
MEAITLKDWLSFSVGGAGLVLGVINLVRSIRLDAPKLSVYSAPNSHFPCAAPGKPTILRVLNHRNNPVTIVDVGFLAKERGGGVSIAGSEGAVSPKMPITIAPGGFVEISHEGRDGLACHYTFERSHYGYFAITSDGKKLETKF